MLDTLEYTAYIYYSIGCRVGIGCKDPIPIPYPIRADSKKIVSKTYAMTLYTHQKPIWLNKVWMGALYNRVIHSLLLSVFHILLKIIYIFATNKFLYFVFYKDKDCSTI